jgi:hypothetical protein
MMTLPPLLILLMLLVSSKARLAEDAFNPTELSRTTTTTKWTKKLSRLDRLRTFLVNVIDQPRRPAFAAAFA